MPLVAQRRPSGLVDVDALLAAKREHGEVADVPLTVERLRQRADPSSDGPNSIPVGPRETYRPIMTPDDLLAVVTAIAAAADPRAERATRIANAIREGGNHRWVGVYQVTDADVVILGYAGPGVPAHPRFPRTQGLTAVAVATGRTVTVDDVTVDPRYLTAFGTTRSEMIVPVLSGDATAAVVGTIDIESDRAAAFGDSERALMERYASAIVSLYRRGDT